MSCMPGGTASNIVAYIARGEMPLSVMMTTASTLTAVVSTPLLTSALVGTLVAVDARALFMSTLQLVLAPVMVGAALNQYVPQVRWWGGSCWGWGWWKGCGQGGQEEGGHAGTAHAAHAARMRPGLN